AGHLTRRTFSDPYWSTRNAAAMAREKVMLFGVPIVTDRPVPLSRIDPELAREMFVRNGLVERNWSAHHEFLTRNDELWEEARELTSRARRPDLLADESWDEARALASRARRRELLAGEEQLVEFYLSKLPEEVTSGQHFDSWWKSARQDDPHQLDFTLDLLVPARHTIDTRAYPEQLVQNDLTLPLTYSYSPGHQSDGLMVHIPIALLPQ